IQPKMLPHQAQAERVSKPADLVWFTSHGGPYHVGVSDNGCALRVSVAQHRPLVDVGGADESHAVIDDDGLGMDIQLLSNQAVTGHDAPLPQGVEVDVILGLDPGGAETSK